MKKLSLFALSAFLGVGAWSYANVPASAAIVCSGDACWHAREVYEYPAEAHVIVHPDDWSWGGETRYRWREHEGRGYWHGDSWEDF